MTLSKDFVPAFTRLDYLNKHCTFREYYGQFVTPATVFRVVHTIGKDKIRASTNEHFNDIPLERWGALVPRLPGSQYFAKAGDYYTQAGGVCLAKEAARQWLELERNDKQPRVVAKLLDEDGDIDLAESDDEASFFSVEAKDAEGLWMVVSDHDTREEAEKEASRI